MRELGDRFAAQGHEVDYASSRQDYRGAKKGGSRTLRELSGLFSILARGCKAQRPDLVISGSSPPCLLIVATLIAWRHQAKSIHWLFDMYPELAVALGEVKSGFGSRLFERLMGWAYRRTNLVIALDADMLERLKKYGVTAEVSRPWVFDSRLTAPVDPPPPPDSGWTWIYSGNLGRAHEWETLLEAQALLEERGPEWRLVFQGGGPSWSRARTRAQQLGLQRCEWKPYAGEAELRDSLLRCRLLTVTQLPETKGLLWPSKLSFALTMPRPLLWVGPTDGAIASELRNYPHAGVFAPGQFREIADWLHRLSSNAAAPVTKTFDAAQHRASTLRKWDEWIAAVGGLRL